MVNQSMLKPICNQKKKKKTNHENLPKVNRYNREVSLQRKAKYLANRDYYLLLISSHKSHTSTDSRHQILLPQRLLSKRPKIYSNRLNERRSSSLRF